jgi:bacillolysin
VVASMITVNSISNAVPVLGAPPAPVVASAAVVVPPASRNARQTPVAQSLAQAQAGATIVRPAAVRGAEHDHHRDAAHSGRSVGVRPTRSDPARVAIFSFDASTGTERRLSSSDLREGGDVVARMAYQNGQRIDRFLRDRFGRNGWDGQGGRLQLVVHATDSPGQGMNNAYWDREQARIYLGDGDGRIFAPLGDSVDVLAHETFHAIVDAEVNLRYEGQQGGINESWADVLGSLADPDNDWLIGEDVYTPGSPNDAIRNLAAPRFSHVNQIPPGNQVGVHDLSGVPSLAAVRVADRIGRDQMGDIWYRALTDHLDSRAGFAGAARATLEAAVELYGHDSAQFAAVMNAWKSVGVNPRFKTQVA